MNVGVEELGIAGDGDLQIAPIIAGNTKAGGLQTIIGAVLLVDGVVISGGIFGAGAPFGSALITMGASMVIGGVIEMLSPAVTGFKTNVAPENTSGYTFGSAKSMTASGNPVPLYCGELRVGGAIISAATVERFRTDAQQGFSLLSYACSGNLLGVPLIAPSAKQGRLNLRIPEEQNAGLKELCRRKSEILMRVSYCDPAGI